MWCTLKKNIFWQNNIFWQYKHIVPIPKRNFPPFVKDCNAETISHSLNRIKQLLEAAFNFAHFDTSFVGIRVQILKQWSMEYRKSLNLKVALKAIQNTVWVVSGHQYTKSHTKENHGMIWIDFTATFKSMTFCIPWITASIFVNANQQSWGVKMRLMKCCF